MAASAEANWVNEFNAERSKLRAELAQLRPLLREALLLIRAKAGMGETTHEEYASELAFADRIEQALKETP